MRLHIPMFFIVVTFAKVVSAAEPSSSDALIEKGIALRGESQSQEALELFQKAHAAAPSGRTLAQMGLAETDLHLWIDAETHVTAALASHDTPWIENATNRLVLEKTLVVIRTHIGLVDIVGPAGVDISIAGRLVGRIPLSAPLHIAEGRVRVEGTAEGRQAGSVNLPVPGGHELTVHLDLPLALVLPSAAVSAPAPTLIDAHPVTESTPWKIWTGGGILTVSAALITTGIIWMAIDGNGTCNPPVGDRCERVYDTKAQGWIAAAIGVAGGVAGGVLLWQGSHSDAHIGLGLGTLTAAGTF